MKMKSWLKYFFIITAILFIVFLGNYLFERYRNGYYEPTLIFTPYILQIAIYVSIGVLLGLEHLLQEVKKAGSMKINLPKLVLLGIPSLYFSFSFFIYFSLGRYFPDILTHSIAISLRTGANFMHLFQLILGYTIITSLYKE